jgi:uncharacterized protein
MIGWLNDKEIEQFLHEQLIARIGFNDGVNVHVVPVSYAYDGLSMYIRSLDGHKIKSMRSHPHVCIEIDDIHDMSNWKSVMAYGEFEELTDEIERKKAWHILLERHLPVNSSITTHLGTSWPFFGHETPVEITGILFRIKLSNKTGKFESTSQPFNGVG